MAPLAAQTERRFTRRNLLRGAALGGTGLALAAGAGCSSTASKAPKAANQSAATPAAAASQPRRGGTVIDARFLVISSKSLDVNVDPPTSNKMRRLWYQGLLAYDLKTLAVQPQLAQKWEQPDQNTYVFTMQPGVKWHNKPPVNGRDFTIDDAVAGLNRVRTNDARFINHSLLDPVDQIQATDKSTLKLTTRQPYAVMLQTLASDGVLFVAPEAATKFGTTFASAETVIGTSPFMLKSWQDNVGAESVAVPNYWKQGLPYLDGFNYRFFGDSQEAYAALLADQVHIWSPLSGTQIKDYISRQGPGYQPTFYKDDVAGTPWLMPNVRSAPFNDARVTRALRLLLDYQELVSANGKAFYADAQYGSAFTQALDQWDFTADEYGKMIFWQQPKDAAVKEALGLLQAAGYSKDKPLKFEAHAQTNSGDPQPPSLAALLQAQWRKFSQGTVDPEIKITDGPTSQKEQAAHSFGFGLFTAAGAFTDPDPWFKQLFRTDGSRNYGGVSVPEADALIDKQGTTFDLAQRKALVKQALQLLIDRSPQATTYRLSQLVGSSKRVQNYTPDGSVTQGRQFEQVWLNG
jgi:peptide/nickel transport system substrate-binding protein